MRVLKSILLGASICTKGLNDIVLSQPAFDSELTLYKFNCKTYEPGPCDDATWANPGDDNDYRDLRRPRVTPCGQVGAQ